MTDAAVVLGRSGVRTSKLGLGCSRIASFTTPYSGKSIERLLSEAFEAGITFYDTADVYGQGDSERILGKVFGRNRNEVVLCTKAGLKVNNLPPGARFLKPLIRPLISRISRLKKGTEQIRSRSQAACFDVEHIRHSMISSMKRLRTDYLDVFLLHYVDNQVLGYDELWQMLERSRTAGEIRALGASCDDPETILKVISYPEIDCLQLPFRLLRDTEFRKKIDAARVAGLGIIAREPFSDYCLDPEAFGYNSKLRRSPAEIALRYSMDLAPDSVILAGVTSSDHLRQNLSCLGSPPVTEEEAICLDRLRCSI